MAEITTALSGDKFGSLTVVEEGEYYISPSGQKSRQVLVYCQCSPSTTFLVRSAHLSSGLSTGCIKCRGRKVGNSKRKNLLGMEFGNLTVVAVGDGGITGGGVPYVTWKVDCKCGMSEVFEVRANSLLTGNSTGCPKCKGKKIGTRLLHSLVGMRFGKLVVLYRGDTIKGATTWVVSCDCSPSITYPVFATSLVGGHSTSCGCSSESGMATRLKAYCVNAFGAIPEYKILKNPNTGRFLPFDIYIPLGKNPAHSGVYIEVNGDQHYRYVPGFHKSPSNFLTTQERDRAKKEFASTHGKYIEVDLRMVTPVYQWEDYIAEVVSSYE